MSRSWILDAASGVRVKLRTTIFRHDVKHLAALLPISFVRIRRSLLDEGTSACFRASEKRASGGRPLSLMHVTVQLLLCTPIPSVMAPALPDDILHLLCEELALQERFDALFNCACASRGFAVPALTHLYRYVCLALHRLPRYVPSRLEKVCLI